MGSDLLVVLLIVLGVVVVWRGPKTLPKLAAALGRGVRQARREVDDAKAGDPPADDEDPPVRP